MSENIDWDELCNEVEEELKRSSSQLVFIQQRHNADTDKEAQTYKDREALLKNIASLDRLSEQAKRAVDNGRRLLVLATAGTDHRLTADFNTLKESVLRLQQRCREAGLRDD